MVFAIIDNYFCLGPGLAVLPKALQICAFAPWVDRYDFATARN
jgi:hypothetical protein